MVDTITGTFRIYERRGRAERRAMWVASRAGNALRHPWRMATVGTMVFVLALVALVLVPGGLRDRNAAVPPPALTRIDTLPYLEANRQAATAYEAAIAELATSRRLFADASRAALARPVEPPETAARRALLTRAVAEVDRLLAAAEAVPLPASWRALAGAAALRELPRTRVLVDSLGILERQRDQFDAGAAVDPTYVALTTRVNDVGRALESLARTRADAMRDDLETLVASRTARSPAPALRAALADTLAASERLRATRDSLDRTAQRLATIRERNALADRRAEAERQRANTIAPPFAILAAALVLAIGAGFGVTLVHEMTSPRVSDPFEVERLTGARVLAVLRPRDVPVERRRRHADNALPPLLDPTADAYRLLTSHVSAPGTRATIIMVTGDVSAVTATIAANISAVAANDALSIMLVDAHFEDGAVQRALGIRNTDGLSAVLARTADWAEELALAPVGRDATIDVLPAGSPLSRALTDNDVGLFKRETLRLARRYDLVVLSSPPALAARLALSPRAIVCAHVAHTRLSTLKAIVTGLRDHGATDVDVVLWDADEPHLPPAPAAASVESAVAQPAIRQPS
jgi:tyrosine-protein kinase Etk/Wzc